MVKRLIVKLLTSKLVFSLYTLIRGSRVRIGSCTFDVNTLPTSHYVKALITYGLYEKAERRLIQKYLPSHLPVIELGSSVGIVTCQIASQTPKKVIAVEANPLLVETIRNQCRTNGHEHVDVVNAAICQGDQMFFHPGDITTTGYVSDAESPYPVRCINAEKDIDQLAKEAYFLVSDIEGAEIALLENKASFLTKCAAMVMELHDTASADKRYSINALKTLIVERGFTIKEEIGSVIYAVKA